MSIIVMYDACVKFKQDHNGELDGKVVRKVAAVGRLVRAAVLYCPVGEFDIRLLQVRHKRFQWHFSRNLSER